MKTHVFHGAQRAYAVQIQPVAVHKWQVQPCSVYMGPVVRPIREKRFPRPAAVSTKEGAPKAVQTVQKPPKRPKTTHSVRSYNGAMLVRSSLEDLGLDHQRFSHKKDIKPWLLKKLGCKKNIGISIERSDAIKVIFRCKPVLSREAEIDPPRRHSTCPFRIRANYLIRNKTWSLVAINDAHDHEVGDLVPKDAAETPEPGSYTFIGDSLGDSLSVGDSLAMDSSIARNTSSGNGSDFDRNRRNSAASSTFHGIINTSYSPEGLENDHEETHVDETRMAAKRPARISFVVQKKPALGPSFSSPTSEMELKESLLLRGLHDRVRDEVRAVVERRIVHNTSISEEERQELLKGFVSQVLSDYKPADDPEKTPKSLLGWMEPSSAGLLSNNGTLIPLSPLLNDSDAEAKLTGSSSDHLSVDPPLMAPMLKKAPKSKSILNDDSYDHDGSGDRLNSLTIGVSAAPSGFMIPSQKQSQLLPSFNMIQNQLPLSPNSLIGSSNHIMPSAFIASSANTYSTTLNPSHLLKNSSHKSNLFGHQQSTSQLFNLGDMKTSSSTASGGANGFLLPAHNSSNTTNPSSVLGSTLMTGLGPINGGISSPTSNSINGLGPTNSSSGRDAILSMGGGTSSSIGGGSSGTNVLNSLILNDSGW